MIQHTLFFPILLDGIINAAVTQIQGILQNLVSVGSACTVGFGGHNVTEASSRFIADSPFGSVRGVANGDGIVVADTIGRLKSFHHKLLHDGGGKPCGTQPYINFRCFQFSGLCLNQRIHIDRKFRVGLGGELRHPQLCPDIAGQVLVCHLPACFRVGGVGGRVFEDHTGKFGGNAPILTGSAQQFCHIGQVHFAMLTNRYRQRFAGGVHAGDGTLRADSALGEHCSLALELPLLVQIFQRAQQIIRGILLKQPPVFAVVQQAVLCGKGIVGGVQTLLCCLDILVRVVVQLLVDQVVDDLPQLHHASDTPLGGVGQLHLRHHGIFPVEHLTVHYGVGEVLHLWVGRQSAPGGFFLGNVGSIHLGGSVLSLDVLYRLGKLVCKHRTLYGAHSTFLLAVLSAFHRQFT